MIERFVDCLRYVYSYKDGKYNDGVWNLNTISGESQYSTSVRFLVWLDYYYGTKENDILLKMFKLIYNKTYGRSEWEPAGRGWTEVFEGTELEGKTMTEAFEMYAESDFAKQNAQPALPGLQSDLIKKYDVRNVIKTRYAAQTQAPQTTVEPETDVPDTGETETPTDTESPSTTPAGETTATTPETAENTAAEESDSGNKTLTIVLIALAVVVVIAVVAFFIIKKKH